MALEIRQQLKLSQQLVMTPQLQQAIKLLQLSRMELIDLVQQELEENPILDEGQEIVEEKELAEEPAASSQEGGAEEGGDDLPEVKGDKEGLNDIDWQTYLEGYNLGGSVADSYEEDDDRPSYENLLTKKNTLTDHLLWQLNLSRFDDQTRQIAAEIIGNLDEDGFFKATLEEVAGATATTPERVEKVLSLVQEFDPPGTAARNLQECLLCQVRVLGMAGSLVESILRDHIHDLENRKYPAIAKALGVSLDEVLEATRIISNLDPRPGRQYNQEDVQYITADIFVYKIGDEFVVVLNDEGLPNLRINAFYRQAMTNDSLVDAKAGEYIQEKLRSAVWLIKSIHQRQRTIYKVTQSIVKFQQAFFEKGIDHLKPLVLRDVAEDIEMHESTISRVTTNKYVQTPQGLYELKFFFNSGIHTTGGDSIASESVKSRIRDLIAGENIKKPYSDRKIVELLEKDNINIARRTVTKYREMLGIGSSTERKRLF
ncbi:RNA polymerase, sigma 54 subunit, RpoN/SigL [Geoalkalibacter ferrihydriticus]|uniref:RNA polymerase sigma54 factor n=2 Tax=Geoalkalibacter ferrihydriticus TaxID=392333 RepID=A0A0C2HUT5_9BACT|nr:RNA polymerase factor sigma-54 [Geoalkalibacter ferrihydriticus]KIH76572.1 RNA polymerase sigma54 factor [Geoalkalibacter ferrihydriticus DSM 17813]SDM02007.1 RNA polymerase, sigma 54 subunit, RpoN/SigL [Geoalkalibacter ferrihydriticus]